MNSNKAIIVANWKTAMPYSKAILWLIQHTNDLIFLSQQSTIILCPEMLALVTARMLLPTTIAIGSQNCSSQPVGKATGQVSAQSLAEAGISYCLINHSEAAQSLEAVFVQLAELNKAQISPILCIASAKNLEQLLATKPIIPPTTMIAFEPDDAIGKNALPAAIIKEEVQHIQGVLKQQNIAHRAILYGGGVNETNSKAIAQTAPIDGFLLGRVSSDFQALQKIVSSC